jgi:hypothetical protein
VKHVVPAAVQAVGSIIENKQPAQTGQGLFQPTGKQRGKGYFDFLFNAARGAAELFSGQKHPISSKGGKIVLDKKYLANQSGRGGYQWTPQFGRGVKCPRRRVKRVKRRKKQKGNGMITDLLKRGAKQALRAAAQTGLDVVDNKRSLKDAIKTHGIRAIKNTAQPLLARGGPHKRSNKRSRQKRNQRPLQNPVKRPIKRPIQRPVKRPLKRAPPKKTRALDIFD